MKINYQQLQGLKVETKSGFDLGRVVDLEIETERHCILKYIVKKGWLKNSLLIDPTQVISIEVERIIVSDTLGEEKTREQTVKNIASRISTQVVEKQREN